MVEEFWVLGMGIAGSVIFAIYREFYHKEKIQKLHERNQQLQLTLEFEKRIYEEKIASIEEAKEQLSEKFEALSREALSKNNEQFLLLAHQAFEVHHQKSKGELDVKSQSIENLVKPLQESLQKLDGGIKEWEKERRGETILLKEQLRQLADSEKELKKETANLIKALRLPDVRGRWGEIQLRRIVELTGLIQYCDFLEQPTLPTKEETLRPDMMIKLPGERNIIIDSKVPLQAFLDSIGEEDEEKKLTHLESHARQLRQHIAMLGKKSYWQHLESTPEFVILFLPTDTLFQAALQVDPSLIELAAGENVVLATPSTLIGLLKAIAYSWKEAKLSEGYKEVARLGAELHKRLFDLSRHFQGLGRQLNSCVDHFNKAMGSYDARVLVTARKFQELGAASHEITLDPIEEVERKAKVDPEIAPLLELDA